MSEEWGQEGSNYYPASSSLVCGLNTSGEVRSVAASQLKRSGFRFGKQQLKACPHKMSTKRGSALPVLEQFCRPSEFNGRVCLFVCLSILFSFLMAFLPMLPICYCIEDIWIVTLPVRNFHPMQSLLFDNTTVNTWHTLLLPFLFWKICHFSSLYTVFMYIMLFFNIVLLML